jgi:DNA repair protein RecN (Recombination protein N)
MLGLEFSPSFMLRYLRIQSLAVIDSAEVEFQPGFNVLTGETGAGKSILVEAVGLLLGGRASGDLVRTGEETATVEAIFETAGAELLVRREITAQGRSRAFIDGTLTTAGALKDLSARLIELHGQHEHQSLLDPTTHLPLLDAFGGLDTLVAPAADAFTRWRAAEADLIRLRTASADRNARQEVAAFQLAEIERAAIVDAKPGEPGEDTELEAARQVLANAERIERLCAESHALLYENEDAALARLAGVWRRVGELAALEPRFQPYLDARAGIKSQLEDLAHFLTRYAGSIEASPARLQQVETRLALLDQLKKKYGPTLADIVARRQALRRELADLEQSDERLGAATRERDEQRQQYLAAATTLSKARKRVGREFAARLEQMLGTLAMERTRFDIRFDDRPDGADAQTGDWRADGFDRAEFFLSPNAGEDLRPLARIVSGGELSRVMLAVKTLTATLRRGFSDTPDRPPSGEAPGLIFDEVDAGIGGRVADVVGAKLRTLGSAFQVLCITHVPQIAAHADTHFQVDKRTSAGRTKTVVRRLTDDERVAEIGRMLGGTAVTDAIRASAHEMLVTRRAAVSRDASDPASQPGSGRGESERAKAKGRTARPQST